MANENDSAENWEFKCGQYDWGEWWEGTKQQLQAVRIGLGVSFPGEPGAPKKLVHTIDTRGVKVDIQSRADYAGPHGVFWATSPYVARQQSARCSEEGPVEYAPGVILIRGLYGTDEFRGTGPALVACGLIEDSQLPGRPGRGKVCCTYTPNGSPRTKGSSSSWTPGMKQVMRRGANRYVIEVRVSEEEKNDESASANCTTPVLQ